MIDECQGHGSLNLSGHVSKKIKDALAALPYFRGVTDELLIKEATVKLRGMRVITDRVTAMLVIAGTRYLDHPELKRTRKA